MLSFLSYCNCLIFFDWIRIQNKTDVNIRLDNFYSGVQKCILFSKTGEKIIKKQPTDTHFFYKNTFRFTINAKNNEPIGIKIFDGKTLIFAVILRFIENKPQIIYRGNKLLCTNKNSIIFDTLTLLFLEINRIDNQFLKYFDQKTFESNSIQINYSYSHIH